MSRRPRHAPARVPVCPARSLYLATGPKIAPKPPNLAHTPALPCYVLDVGGRETWLIDVPPGVALSRKGAKSRTGGRKLRSTGTRLRTRVAHGRGATERLQQQLEARTRELAEAQRHADEARRQLAEA